MSNNLPNGWEAVPLKDLIIPRSNRVSPQSIPDAPFIGMEHVEPHTNRVLETVPASTMASNAARFYEGDVLYGRMRPYLNKVVSPSFDGLASAEFIVFPRSEAIDSHFLLRRLSSSDFTEFACSQYEGDRPRVKFDQLGNFNLLLPPIAEQGRIVEKLEELLSDLDAGIAELTTAKHKLAQYRQLLLKAAVEGSLTAGWRAVQGQPQETSTELLQRLLAERRVRWEQKQLAKFSKQGKTPPKGWQAKYPEPLAPDLTDATLLPEGWTWASLGQLLESLTSGSRDWAPYYNRGVCTFVMAQNVRPWRPDFTFHQQVDPPLDDRDRARSKVEKDDLLITIVGANTGQSCRVPEELEEHFVCQSVALLRATERSMSEFLNAVLNSNEHGQRQFREMNYGAGRPHLSFEQIESVLVPVPPAIEQKQILLAIEEGTRKIESIEVEIAKILKQASAQRKKLLKAAFAGQLVSQDANDEPAGELLIRIHAARSSSAGASQRRRRKSA